MDQLIVTFNIIGPIFSLSNPESLPLFLKSNPVKRKLTDLVLSFHKSIFLFSSNLDVFLEVIPTVKLSVSTKNSKIQIYSIDVEHRHQTFVTTTINGGFLWTFT